MPLRDPFRPPLSEVRSWEEVHGGWPMVIVQQLRNTLPPQYTTGPRIHLGAEVEVDVATFVSEPAADWTPAEPTLALETWYQSLTPGLPLPTLPLWLAEDLAISLDLEASYEQNCCDLPIA